MTSIVMCMLFYYWMVLPQVTHGRRIPSEIILHSTGADQQGKVRTDNVFKDDPIE